MQKTFLVSKIFTGDEWLTDHAIIINNGLIESIVPQLTLENSNAKDYNDAEDYRQFIFVPPFIDAQVYGAGKKLLAAHPDAETLRLMNETFYRQGTVLFVPTVATNTMELFKKCIDAVIEYWKQGG